jgi:antitoxin (DNA-binding transcriptional repressor) of toxin-antitoxin stability system
VASGQEKEITIARHGKPAARIVPLRERASAQGMRLGAARGQFVVPDSIDVSSAEAAALLNGSNR